MVTAQKYYLNFQGSQGHGILGGLSPSSHKVSPQSHLQLIMLIMPAQAQNCEERKEFVEIPVSSGEEKHVDVYGYEYYRIKHSEKQKS